MAQRNSSIPRATQASRGERSGRNSPQSGNTPNSSRASSQHSNSSSEHDTPSTSRPPSRLPTPVKSDRNQTCTPSPRELSVDSTARNESYSDEQSGSSAKERTAKYKGKEPEVYGDSEALERIETRLSRVEDKLAKVLSRKRQSYPEESLQTATEEQIQSSQIYQDLKTQYEGLEEQLKTRQTELTHSRQAYNQALTSLQEFQPFRELLDIEGNKRKGRDIENLEMSPENHQYMRVGWFRALDFCDEGWAMADRYKAENIDLRNAKEDLEKMVEAYELEHINRRESQTDRASQTEPEVASKITESQGTEASIIDWNLNTTGEIEPYGQRSLEPIEVQNDEEGLQNIRSDDPQRDSQDGLQHSQQEVSPDEPEVRPQVQEGLYDVLLEDNQQAVAQEQLQVRMQEESHDFQEKDQEEAMAENLQEDEEESEQEETRSADKEVICNEGQMERLMSTTQEPTTGEMELDQPTVEVPAEQSPPKTQDVAVVDIASVPNTTEPVDRPDSARDTHTESRRNRAHHDYGRSRHRPREIGDRRRHRDHHRDRDERHRHRHNHRNDRPRNTPRWSRRRRQETPLTGLIKLREFVQTYFRFELLFPKVKLVIQR